MQPTVTLEQAIGEFRRMLPAATNTARAIDRGAPWEQTAIDAVMDGYIDEPRELGNFIEVCVKKHIMSLV
jgi:hypothetical protein